MEPNSLPTRRLQDQIFFVYYHFHCLYILLPAFPVKKLHIICMFWNKHFQQITSILIFKSSLRRREVVQRQSLYGTERWWLFHREALESSCNAGLRIMVRFVLGFCPAYLDLVWFFYLAKLRRTKMAFCLSNWVLSTLTLQNLLVLKFQGMNFSQYCHELHLWHQAFLGDHFTSLSARHAECIVPVKIFPEMKSMYLP